MSRKLLLMKEGGGGIGEIERQGGEEENKLTSL